VPSNALGLLLLGLDEVRDLQRANPTPLGELPTDPDLARAVNRASVVLLYSHLERYLRNLNEEATEVVNASAVEGSRLPERLRLRHSRLRIEDLAKTQWTRRSEALKEFASLDSWLWGPSTKNSLEHGRLVDWMKSVKPGNDIFIRITRAERTRTALRLKLQELDDKRHNIAHGHYATEATQLDIREYIQTVSTFCKRVDVALSRKLAVILEEALPW
jgi:hypothetical protein